MSTRNRNIIKKVSDNIWIDKISETNYEVLVVDFVKEDKTVTIHENTFTQHKGDVIYPSVAQWGVNGFTCMSYESALHLAKHLIDELKTRKKQ